MRRSEDNNTGRLGAFLVDPKIGSFALLLLCLVGLYFFAYREMRFFLVPSSSMEPSLYETDQLVTLSQWEYRRGDIVVVDEPDLGEYIVKRIAGVAGDVITVVEGGLYIGGEYVSEPYLKEPMEYAITDPVRVPEGRVFLLGDNRNMSEDGHVDGSTVDTGDIVGQVRFIYYPYERLGVVHSYPLTNALGE